jgi:hypothetical protein
MKQNFPSSEVQIFRLAGKSMIFLKRNVICYFTQFHIPPGDKTGCPEKRAPSFSL